jgi:para-aminobenzoate synthetase/4-amino-4-deoxychorismate lyase
VANLRLASTGLAAFASPGGGALVFERPQAMLVARAPSDVAPLLAALDAALAGGAWVAGMLAYEAAPGLDRALVTCAPGPLPLAWFGLFDPPRRLPLAEALGMLGAPAGAEPSEPVAWSPSLDDSAYAARVARVREAIARGDTYQVNLTWRLRAPFAGSAPALLARMLQAQPVPHAAYLDLGGHAICSASPELFFRRRGRLLVCRPMKGTAPRGRFECEDEQRAAALASSEKERAENLMIVDMVRNDLGRVSRAGSVRTSRLCRAERYATLWQLTSTVAAESDAPLSAVLAALFPSASVTGAPKPRTMALIADLEGEPRGAYTGTLGWAGPGGRARFNVAIRTVWVDRRRGVAEYGTGGGVTWDSAAAAEHAESRLKASVLLAAPPTFELLETLRWSPTSGYFLLAGHLRRLGSSARYFGFRRDRRVDEALRDLAASLPPVLHRVRLRLARDGAVAVDAEPLPFERERLRWRVALAPNPVDPTDPLLFHKTTRRDLYDAARAACPGCDDVLLWNPDGELTESTVANLVVALDGALVTPPVACGLLPGTFREHLLARGRLVERVVRREDLARAGGVWLVNSVRGWIRIRIEAPRG